VTLVTDLNVTEFDYLDPYLRGPRFHQRMRQLHSAGWLAHWPVGYFVLDREAVEFFLRSKKVTFPGLKMAEIFGVTEGPLFEEISHNILSLNGEDHRRLRNLVNPAFAPRAVERYPRRCALP
jgi:cytochrome P450